MAFCSIHSCNLDKTDFFYIQYEMWYRQQTVMEFQLLFGHVVLLPINVTREKATVIGTQTVLEVLPAEPIIVEQLELLEAIGVALQIAAKVRCIVYIFH